jgi:hypothetical protein
MIRFRIAYISPARLNLFEDFVSPYDVTSMNPRLIVLTVSLRDHHVQD